MNTTRLICFLAFAVRASAHPVPENPKPPALAGDSQSLTIPGVSRVSGLDEPLKQTPSWPFACVGNLKRFAFYGVFV
jgi:hypothetical protein